MGEIVSLKYDVAASKEKLPKALRNWMWMEWMGGQCVTNRLRDPMIYTMSMIMIS